jgi:hypothetical protein
MLEEVIVNPESALVSEDILSLTSSGSLGGAFNFAQDEDYLQLDGVSSPKNGGNI